MHARGQRSRWTWVGAFPHLLTLENGDEDHQPRSGSAPAARVVLLPQIAQYSEHVHQLCSRALCVWRALGVVLVLFDVHAAGSPASAEARD